MRARRPGAGAQHAAVRSFGSGVWSWKWFIVWLARTLFYGTRRCILWLSNSCYLFLYCFTTGHKFTQEARSSREYGAAAAGPRTDICRPACSISTSLLHAPACWYGQWDQRAAGTRWWFGCGGGALAVGARGASLGGPNGAPVGGLWRLRSALVPRSVLLSDCLPVWGAL